MASLSRVLVPTAALAAGVALLAGCSSGSGSDGASASGADGLTWTSCADLQRALGGTGVDEALLDRVECANVDVPLDYADPGGRQISLAISRLRPEGDAGSTILLNPGGPGIEGRSMPVSMASMNRLSSHAALVGVDVRGTGASTSVNCDAVEALEPGGTDPGAARAYADRIAAANADCVATDPAFFRQMTTANAARDLDQVRAALGLDTVSYFAASWGTGLGAAYRDLFPTRVAAMALDSMNTLGTDYQRAVRDVAEADRQYPPDAALADAPAVPDQLTDGPDATGTPTTGPEPTSTESVIAPPPTVPAEPVYNPLNITARLAYACNAFAPVGDFDEQWTVFDALNADLQRDPADRVALPGSSEVPGVSACTGWDAGAELPGTLAHGDGALLIVGHTRETVTPYVWAQQAQAQIGGTLYTIDDAAHAGAVASHCGNPVFDYLTGAAAPTGTCAP